MVSITVDPVHDTPGVLKGYTDDIVNAVLRLVNENWMPFLKTENRLPTNDRFHSAHKRPLNFARHIQDNKVRVSARGQSTFIR